MMTLMESIKPTTWLHFDEVDDAVGIEVHFAAEIYQVTHSFKYRAAAAVVQNIDASGFWRHLQAILVRRWLVHVSVKNCRVK